jgi:hypothetical protein
VRRWPRTRVLVGGLLIVAAATAVTLYSVTPDPMGSGETTTSGAVFPGPASLTQTRSQPAATNAALARWSSPLWIGVIHDSTVDGLGDLLPEPIYAALVGSRVADPATTYVRSVQSAFQLDIAAYHATLSATVPPTSTSAVGPVRWVSAAECGTAVGFWFLSAVRWSFGKPDGNRVVLVLSLISWRGQWYVGRFGNPSDVAGAATVATRVSGASDVRSACLALR